MVGVKSFLLTSLLFYFGVVNCVDGVEDASKTIYEELNKFALKFSKAAFENKSDNVICSPLSTAIILLMMKYGAKSATYEALKNVLDIDEKVPANNEIIGNLMNFIQNFPDVKVKLANKIYVSKDINLNSEYKNKSMTIFNSEVGSVDFGKASEAADNINEWCSKQTENKIKNIVDPQTLNPNTKLMLINALYFFGEWKDKFTLLNETHDFYLESGEKRSVKMMKSGWDNFIYGSLRDNPATFVRIPYKYSTEEPSTFMTIILPNKNKTLNDIDLTKISMSNLDSDQDFYVDSVRVILPKFVVESKLDLVTPLRQLGLGSLFENDANLSGISEDADLKVDSAIQKSFLDVNENGSEAAAVTIVGGVPLMAIEDINFKVNRPFYIILSTKDVITFVGRVTDIKDVTDAVHP